MYPRRLKIFFICLVAFHLALVGRLVQLQLVHGGKYSGLSKKRLIKEISVSARRGNIYDRYGRSLAFDEASFDLTVRYKNLLYSYYASKKELPKYLLTVKAHRKKDTTCKECHPNDDLWVERAAQLLDINTTEILSRTEGVVKRVEAIKESVQERHKKRLRIQEELINHLIAKDIPVEKLAELESRLEQYPGVYPVVNIKRHYPNGELACHVLGYLGKLSEEEWQKIKTLRSESQDSKLDRYYNALSKDTLVGRSGIESQYDVELQGKPGKRIEEVVLKTLKVDKTIFNMAPKIGNDLFLAIDIDIQRLAEAALKGLGGKNGSIVVMEVNTGEILALASHPGFNPNTFNLDYRQLADDPSKPFLNRPLQAALPPGSAFKPIVALAALEEGGITNATQFFCGGKMVVGDRAYHCISAHYQIEMERAIEHSCNIYFYEIAKKLKGESLEKMARAFGLGQRTGIDLPFEGVGLVPKVRSLGERLNFSIGQGDLLVTPLQMTRVMATIANGGKIVGPHLLKKVVSLDEEVAWENAPRSVGSVVIPSEHLKVLQNALRKVVVSGTARGKGLDPLLVAGKTGTSQIGLKGLYHAWFCGYLPYNNPRYCFCVVVEEVPGHGGEIAAPVAREIAQGLLSQDTAKLTAKKEMEQ